MLWPCLLARLLSRSSRPAHELAPCCPAAPCSAALRASADDGGSGARRPHHPPVHVCPSHHSGHRLEQHDGCWRRPHDLGAWYGSVRRRADGDGRLLLFTDVMSSCRFRAVSRPAESCLLSRQLCKPTTAYAATLPLQEAGKSAGLLSLAIPPSVAKRGGFAAADAMFDGYGAGGGLTWRKAKLLLEKKQRLEGGATA